MPDDEKDKLHYRVQCAMCGGSLEAESDTLKELFDIARDHLVKYAIKHESKGPIIQGKPPTNREIFDNKVWFRWGVINMMPFNAIRERVNKEIIAAISPI